MKVLPDRPTNADLDGARLFVVIGAQRTGTNILREILNSNNEIAMLGEVLSPSAAPAHWDNFCRDLPDHVIHPAGVEEAEALLDQYFEFVRYRVHNHWQGNAKANSRAFGVDIKYNQLEQIAPANWASATPFILYYLQSRRATLIHTTRNVIHCAISALIASERNLWHNYEGAAIDRSYHIDAAQCLGLARAIIQQRNAFVKSTSPCVVVDCRYESLIEELERAGSRQEIPEGPGPLKNIASALATPFRFSYDGRLQRAIDVPYARLISNYDALNGKLRDSEFASLARTLA